LAFIYMVYHNTGKWKGGYDILFVLLLELPTGMSMFDEILCRFHPLRDER